jgi:hypothetical protein
MRQNPARKASDSAERGERHAAKDAARGIERSGAPAAPAADISFLFLPLAFMFFDQRDAGAEDRGQGQEQSACDRSPDVRRQSGRHRCKSAEDEAQDGLAPASFLESANLRRTSISYPSKACLRPMATPSQAAADINVAASAEQRARINSWQTRKLSTASAIAPRLIDRASIET